MRHLTTFLLLVYITGGTTVKVYDCEGNRSTYEVVDLTSTADCPNPQNDYHPEETRRIQVTHQNPVKRIEGRVCRVVYTKTATTCNLITNTIYGTQTPIWRQPYLVTPKECWDVVHHEFLMFEGKKVAVEFGTQKNSTCTGSTTSTTPP